MQQASPPISVPSIGQDAVRSQYAQSEPQLGTGSAGLQGEQRSQPTASSHPASGHPAPLDTGTGSPDTQPMWSPSAKYPPPLETKVIRQGKTVVLDQGVTE